MEARESEVKDPGYFSHMFSDALFSGSIILICSIPILQVYAAKKN